MDTLVLLHGLIGVALGSSYAGMGYTYNVIL